jgi:hypothetical protein
VPAPVRRVAEPVTLAVPLTRQAAPSGPELAARIAALGPPPPFLTIAATPARPIQVMGLAPAPPLPADRDPNAGDLRLMNEIGRPPPYRPIMPTGELFTRAAAGAPLPVMTVAPATEPVAPDLGPTPAPAPAPAIDPPPFVAPPPSPSPPRMERPARYLEEPVPRAARTFRIRLSRDVVIGLLVILALAAGALLLERRQVMRRYPATIPLFESLHLTDRPSR